MSGTPRDQMHDAFGAYVRSQRHLARLTLRQAAGLARISNPYLSQIEHGLALPSIAVISALADALSVSAETLLLRAAGIASPTIADGLSHTEDAIRQDSRLDDRQKHALLAVLASFVAPSFVAPSPGAAPGESGAAPGESGAAPGESGAAPGESGAATPQGATSVHAGTRRDTPTDSGVRQQARPVPRQARPVSQQPLEPPALDEEGPDNA